MLLVRFCLVHFANLDGFCFWLLEPKLVLFGCFSSQILAFRTFGLGLFVFSKPFEIVFSFSRSRC